MDRSAIIVRLPQKLHKSLKSAARRAECSLNRYCTQLLAQAAPASPASAGQAAEFGPLSRELSEVVEVVRAAFDQELDGLVLFGSFARGTAGPGSDVDLLVVLKPAVRVDRDHYARLKPLRCGSREVSPLLVSLPSSHDEFRGVWLEISLDGIVLFDRDFGVSRYLAKVRGFIAEGRVKRRMTHGHPYWVPMRGDDSTGGGSVMRNEELAKDYLLRAQGRLKAVDALYGEKMWADVVRESQEVVELALKGMLRFFQVEVPRVHDVSEVLEQNQDLLPPVIKIALPELVDISQDLRRDRELAFYGSEDVTPHAFYKQKHAAAAREKAGKVVRVCREGCGL